jgi:hypothetical protein
MTDNRDPDDAALLAVLRTEQTGAWRELAKLDEDFRARPRADDDFVWPTQEGQMPFPIYSARVGAACRVLEQIGAVTPVYLWMEHAAPVPGLDGIVSPADAVRLATTIVRSERFCDGNTGAAVEAGLLQAVLAALAAWYREQAA